MDFCTSSDFERRFEDFAREHAPTFLAAPDLREGDEQPVEFHQAYLKYLQEFEALIEGFILQVITIKNIEKTTAKVAITMSLT